MGAADSGDGGRERAGVERRTFLHGAAWSVPVLAMATAVPAASASGSPFSFSWSGAGPSARVLYPDQEPVPSSRLGRSVLYSTFHINATETNTSDLTVAFVVGLVVTGHTNYLGMLVGAVGVLQLGGAQLTAWHAGTPVYNSLPVTSEFRIPANSLSVGANAFPLTWLVTGSQISYPGPFAKTGYSFSATVAYEGEPIFTDYANGYVVDSTDPVQLNHNDIFG